MAGADGADSHQSVQSLRRITTDPSHPDRAALVQVEWALHLLWFLVEAAVLLMKVFWPRTDSIRRSTAAPP